VSEPPSIKPRIDGFDVRYPRTASMRDERLDFIRGFAAISFVTAHFEAFTWFNFLFSERLGIYSGAGLFMIISGLLIGMTNRELVNRDEGIGQSVRRAVRRSFEIYRAYVVVIAIVAVVAALNVIDTTAVTTFTDRFAGQTYPLYPPAGTPVGSQILSILLLRSTPHEVQILGCYVILLLLVPFAIMALRAGKAWLICVPSIPIWFLNMQWDTHLTGAQFEYAFPTLSWQLYFLNGMVVGWYARYELAAWFARNPSRKLLVTVPAVLFALAGFVFAQATDNPSFPVVTRLDILPPEQFRAIYDRWFGKNLLMPARALNDASFLFCFYLLLTRFWVPLRKALGWFLIPLGQASLYVFLTHVLFIAAADQIPGYFEGVPRFDWNSIWFNTAVLAAILLSLWAMVKIRFLFRIIPT
jgi:peptidoglycan/LPS O-acetylase OafA/YrhL